MVRPEQKEVSVIALFIPGEPKAAPRPRRAATGHFYVPDVDRNWKTVIQWHLNVRANDWKNKHYSGPFAVHLGFVLKTSAEKQKRLMPPNFTASAYDTRGMDCDNLAKSVLDAITELGLWHDDRQVTELHVTKRYGKEPGLYLTVKRIVEAEDGLVREALSAGPVSPITEA